MLIAFLFFMFVVLAIGLASALRSRGTNDDYYLASRSVSPALVGLSAVATNNSGYMFIGVIGFTYMTGLAAIWLMVGWILGDFLASMIAHRKVREAAERTRQLSFAGVLGCWLGFEQRWVRTVAAFLTIAFLGAYAGAQLRAGGKALQALFGWELQTGAMLVAAMVAAYCLAGGIRASIWTDVVQSVIMLASMGLLLIAAVNGLGGVDAAIVQLDSVPNYLDWFPVDLIVPGAMGMGLFVVGWLFAGLSVLGQPHIMIRFMTLKAPGDLAQARFWYYGFFLLFYSMATAVGMLSRIYLPELAALDPEMALPQMAQMLLSPVFVGLILAGIFAATMSTADSLLLSCSAALTHDLAPESSRALWMSKFATLLFTALALGIAITGPTSVFTLVIVAWSTLASAFAPLLLVYALNGRPRESLALTMMVTGPLVALAWRHFDLHQHIYEGMPGILAGLLTFGVGTGIGIAWEKRTPSNQPV